MISIRLAILPIALAATPLLADAPPSSGPSGDGQAEKKVCRVVAATGSIMRNRICKTKAEWAMIDGINAENAARAMDTRSSTGRVEGY